VIAAENPGVTEGLSAFQGGPRQSRWVDARNPQGARFGRGEISLAKKRSRGAEWAQFEQSRSLREIRDSTAPILALALGASLVPAAAAVTDPTPTAALRTAAVATPSSLYALSHVVADMGFWEAQDRETIERGVRESPLALHRQAYLSWLI